MRFAALALLIACGGLGDGSLSGGSLSGGALRGGGLGAPPASGAVCGNNVIEGAEVCDDGNTSDGDGCADDCLSCGEPLQTSLSFWFDARDIDGDGVLNEESNGALVASWADKGSVGDAAVQAGADSIKPVVVTNCIDTDKPCVRFDGDALLQIGTAANGTFLSNGSDWTAYVVWKSTSSNPNACLTAFSTGNSGNAIGVNVWHDDRAASSREDKLVFNIGNGSANPINYLASDDTLPAGAWHAMVVALDDDGGGGADGFTWVDGASTGTTSASTTYSASAPGKLTIGRIAGLAACFHVGDIAQIMIYAASHGATTRDDVEDWISCTYATEPLIAQSHLHLGDSITIAGSGVTPHSTVMDTLSALSFVKTNKGVAGVESDYIYGTEWAAETGKGWDRVFVLGGINDVSAGDEAAGIYANLANIYTEASAQGAYVVAMTVLPWGNAVTWTSGKQTVLESLNALILADPTANLIVDLYTLMGEPGTPIDLAAAYDSGDGVHPNQDGQDFIATTLNTALGL